MAGARQDDGRSLRRVKMALLALRDKEKIHPLALGLLEWFGRPG
jgi:hypothetical protein